MRISIAIAYDYLPGEPSAETQGTILDALIQGDIPTAMTRKQELETTLQALLGPKNVKLTLRWACPVCGHERSITPEGAFATCVACGDPAPRWVAAARPRRAVCAQTAP